MDLSVNRTHRHYKDYRKYKVRDISQDTDSEKTIKEIINDPALSREEKQEKIKEYLKTTGGYDHNVK
jgi:F0F1-type ATP synthase delta subunit